VSILLPSARKKIAHLLVFPPDVCYDKRMKISTKGRYALRLMLDLAEHRGDGFIALKDVAERQNVSKKYLEQIVPPLQKADMLQSGRGLQGGYRLAKDPAQYTVGEILRRTEGSLSTVRCLDGDIDECPHSPSCLTLPIWQGLNRVIDQYLDGITLQDVLDRTCDKL
jgi:Rrf2 family protein